MLCERSIWQMKLALCGHRLENLPFPMDSESYSMLELALWKTISKYMDSGYETFICSATQGMGIVMGEIVAAIKGSGVSGTKLNCVIPFREQARKGDDVWRLRYRYLLHDADRIIQVCDNYQRGCYQKQSRTVVDACDALLAVYDEKDKGRTAYAVQYALKHGKPVEIINPYNSIVEEQEQKPYYR